MVMEMGHDQDGDYGPPRAALELSGYEKGQNCRVGVIGGEQCLRIFDEAPASQDWSMASLPSS